ncbi:hypothetical protein N8I77_007130 [Diaporthe amygdali]|uniref:Uncharacterized protein n=1 Tax=Phomopsis amygdali TaxID=1214568 RepID=A0AAD9W1K4_PHOAM|nr:hypothetical protein N8I77_007130 [Diaporthe amygdali]
MELYPVSLNSHRYIRAPIHFEGGLLIVALLISLAIIAVVFRLPKSEKFKDGLMTANKLFRYEPAVFARFRWIINARKILRAADKKAQGHPYRLYRGDTDQIVLPTSMIPELNGLGIDCLNSRESHSFGLLGHLTGMDVVRVTSFHVRVLLSYISPALPSLFAVMGERISAGVQDKFPQSHEWMPMKPSKAVVHCISEAIALILFGAEMTRDIPELVHLSHEHTNNGTPSQEE